jgi:hypothetical protein
MSIPTTQVLGGSDGPEGPGGPPEGTAQSISRFVDAVRAQLDDLSDEEVIELTGGLEADLTDALAEEGATPAERYGDPVEYARELRSAAGLPPRRSSPSRAGGGPAWSAVGPQQRYQDAVRSLEQQPWWPSVRDFLVVLRPAWWVLRAWVAVQLVMLSTVGSDVPGMLGGTGDGVIRGGWPGFLLLLVAVVISVQLGRRTPLPQHWQRRLVLIGNVFAVLVLLPVISSTQSSRYNEGYAVTSSPSRGGSGLVSNGNTVTNIFPYDGAGNPLTGVQLYDQDGQPLEIGPDDRTSYDDVTGQESQLVPGSPEGSAPRWNAFPMQRRLVDGDTGTPGPLAPVPLPLTGVPTASVAGPSAAPTAAPTAGPSAGPSSTASPSSPTSSISTSTATKR